MARMTLNEALNMYRAGNGFAVDKTNAKHVCAFQDAIGNSSMSDIQVFFQDLSQSDQDGFLFCCVNCLDYGMVRAIIQHTIINVERRRMLADVTKRSEQINVQLDEREKELEDREQSINNLEAGIETRDRMIEDQKQTIIYLRSFERDAKRYWTIREALQD